MAGIYLHIPFCKQACYYCDFHFSTNLSKKSEMVAVIKEELKLRKSYLSEERIDSIYFGGGTPSLLQEAELQGILATVRQNYTISEDAEITLEANPDDLSRENLQCFLTAGINRLSIGIQTFDDSRLRFIHRAHTACEALQSLENARMKFENITADLIYGIPPDDISAWESDLKTMLSFDLPHLSIYGLTIEERTVFGHRARKGTLAEISEESAARHYQLAVDLLAAHGYERYEVSNFAKPGFYSRHNSSYWDDQKYLGVGPGAHSYDGYARAYNVSNNARYMDTIRQGKLPLSIEKRSHSEQLNEYLYTRLRTKQGLEMTAFAQRFGRDLYLDHRVLVDQLIADGLLKKEDWQLTLTNKGFLLADEISLRLFYDE